MKNLKAFLFLIISITLLSNISFSQTKSASKRMTDAAGGYSVEVPSNLQTIQNEEGIFLSNAEKTIIIVVKSHNSPTFDEFMQQANLAADGFVAAEKTNAVGTNGRAFFAAKRTGDKILFLNGIVMISPFQGGVFIAAFSDEPNNDAAFKTAYGMVKTLQFSKPVETDASVKWQTALRGKHLLYLYASNGFSERTDIYLCPSGEFFMSSDSSSLSANGSGAAGANNSGMWKVSSRGGASLVLQFRNGATREYVLALRQASNEINLNGNRYFVQSHNECR